MRKIGISGVGLIILSLSPLLSWSGEMYRWTDEKGTVHFTDDRSKIPKKYLDQVERREVPRDTSKEPPKVIPKAEKTDDSPDRVKAYLDDLDRRIEEKKKLEQRVSALEDELRSAEERVRWIEEDERENFQYYQPFRDPRTGRWAPVASPYYAEKVRLLARIDEIKSDLASLEEKLSKIQRGL